MKILWWYWVNFLVLITQSNLIIQEHGINWDTMDLFRIPSKLPYDQLQKTALWLTEMEDGWCKLKSQPMKFNKTAGDLHITLLIDASPCFEYANVYPTLNEFIQNNKDYSINQIIFYSQESFRKPTFLGSPYNRGISPTVYTEKFTNYNLQEMILTKDQVTTLNELFKANNYQGLPAQVQSIPNPFTDVVNNSGYRAFRWIVVGIKAIIMMFGVYSLFWIVYKVRGVRKSNFYRSLLLVPAIVQLALSVVWINDRYLMTTKSCLLEVATILNYFCFTILVVTFARITTSLQNATHYKWLFIAACVSMGLMFMCRFFIIIGYSVQNVRLLNIFSFISRIVTFLIHIPMTIWINYSGYKFIKCLKALRIPPKVRVHLRYLTICTMVLSILIVLDYGTEPGASRWHLSTSAYVTLVVFNTLFQFFLSTILVYCASQFDSVKLNDNDELNIWNMEKESNYPNIENGAMELNSSSDTIVFDHTNNRVTLG